MSASVCCTEMVHCFIPPIRLARTPRFTIANQYWRHRSASILVNRDSCGFPADRHQCAVDARAGYVRLQARLRNDLA